MTYADVGDVNDTSLTGSTKIEEIENYQIKSLTGQITIVAGDILCYDTAVAPVAVGRVSQQTSSQTTGVPVGVAMDSMTIPATTAAGDKLYTIRVLRRGFHPAVNVGTGGAAGNVVVTGAAAVGRGTATPVGSVTAANATCVLGIMLAAASSNAAPVWVQPQL